MSPPLSFGGLFKRKEKKVSLTNNSAKQDLSQSGSEGTGGEHYKVGTDYENKLSISDALDILRKIEDEKVGDMSRTLIPIKQSLESTLLSIGRLAEEMENEKIKIEDEKFKPSVESSRRILVSSLKKEVSSDYPTPTSISEALKFKGSLQSLMERFGDVSGSHSKLLTTFMKKHTGKIKGEFDVISSLEKRANKIMVDFEEDRRPVANCIATINKVSQMISTLQQQENEFEKVKNEISRLEVEGQNLSRTLVDLERSPDFESTSETIKEMLKAEEEKKEFQKYLVDLFSPVSRALTKYSYGTSKATSSKLHTIMDAPWKIFEETYVQKEVNDNAQESASRTAGLESFKSVIIEVHKAVAAGKITLKDSQKTIKSFDLIINSLPELQKRSQHISDKLVLLEQKKDKSIMKQADTLRAKLRENKSSLDNHRLYLERLENEIKDRNNNLKRMVNESEECFSKVTGKNYAIRIS
ncbi:MAG TPA: hypothetical protein VFR94_04320 [Nitrososphaeraceae archaeon]|nr:hypothetical protein [Nitrososphaeraceae archaeon]